MTRSRVAALARFAWVTLVSSATAQEPAYPHDHHRPHALPTTAANDVRQLAADDLGGLWAATADGLYHLERPDAGWKAVGSGEVSGPVFSVVAGPEGRIWCGAWNGLWKVQAGSAVRVPAVPGPVRAVAVGADGSLLSGGPDGYHEVRAGLVRPLAIPATRYLQALTAGRPGEWWLATGMGIHHWDGRAGRYWLPPLDRYSVAVRELALDPDGRLWAATLGGVQVFEGARLIRHDTAEDGLPSADVRSILREPDGTIWIGTAAGVARREADRWAVRAGRRWLLDDDVRDLARTPDGTLWVATGAGVSALASVPLTLSAKAQHFHAILESRHVRPPGIVEKCQLRSPGDVSTWAPMDDDNDGGYTALALAMESFRWAATRDPAARTAARRAFHACEFLQRVTGTPGFLARTVVPADWTEMHDPNEILPEAEWAAQRAEDPRNKRVPVRWRPSADGRWLWKGDTSSDEVTAHFFGYFVFHQLAADDRDRVRIREQVCRIVDHLIEHGYQLQDLDGRPTRWAIWGPDRLNRDPDWAMERGINSVEILSFLKLAHHVSGDTRYADHYHRLLTEHRYDRNVLEAPNLNPAWRTYIDMELLAFAYPALLALESDPRLARLYRRSFERWHEAIREDGNPFFEFLYARHARPNRARLDAARAFLIDTPLDLVRWDVDLTRREDLRVRRWPEVEQHQIDRRLPPSELGYSRTDQNPWRARQGDGGRTESDGVFWLLPYWMGRQAGWLPAGETASPTR